MEFGWHEAGDRPKPVRAFGSRAKTYLGGDIALEAPIDGPGLGARVPQELRCEGGPNRCFAPEGFPGQGAVDAIFARVGRINGPLDHSAVNAAGMNDRAEYQIARPIDPYRYLLHNDGWLLATAEGEDLDPCLDAIRGEGEDGGQLAIRKVI